MPGFYLPTQGLVGKYDRILAVECMTHTHRYRNDVNLEWHAGADPSGKTRLDRTMQPLVIAGKVARIECRSQAAAGQCISDGRKDLASLYSNIGALIPGHEAFEIRR